LRVGHRGTTACAHTSALRLRLNSGLLRNFYNFFCETQHKSFANLAENYNRGFRQRTGNGATKGLQFLGLNDEGVPLGIGYRRSVSKKTRMMGQPGRERNLTISSAVWIQCTNVTDGRSDGHWATEKTALTQRRAVKTFGRSGLYPRTPLGSSQRSPDPLASGEGFAAPSPRTTHSNFRPSAFRSCPQ